MGSRIEITYNDFAEAGAEEGLKAAIVVTSVRLHAAAVDNQQPDTGRLRNSLMWVKGWESDNQGFPQEGGFNSQSGEKADKKIEEPNGLSAYMGTAVEYAIYEEKGTRYRAAKPYLGPAGDEVRGKGAEEIKRKWGPDAMAKEFDSRIKRTKRYG